MSIGQASNAAIPVFGRFILKVFDDPSIVDVRPEDLFEAPAVINFSLNCADKGVNADTNDTYAPAEDVADTPADVSDCGESDIFNF